MSLNHHKRVLVAVAALTGLGAVAVASAQPPDFVRAEQQRKAFVRAQASSKAPAPAQPANEAEAIREMKVLADGIIEIPLPEDRMLYTRRVVDAQGKVHVGHIDLEPSNVRGNTASTQEKPHE